MYEFWMESKRLDSICLTEIGIGLGGSARMWHEYFPNGTVSMIDNFKEFAQTPRYIEGISIEVGEQTNPDTWESIEEQDFIIDDGSHKPIDCIKTLEIGFNKLKYGGLYFIEDTHCNFHSRYSADDLLYNWVHKIEQAIQTSSLSGDFYKSRDALEGIIADIYAIHLYKSVIVIQKACVAK
jgi:hypothetical protein